MNNLLLRRAKELLRPLLSRRPQSSVYVPDARKAVVVHHFHRRNALPPLNWYQKLTAAILITGGTATGLTLYYRNNLQTVPYTNRTRFVFMSPSTESKLGSFSFKIFKSRKGVEFLYTTHPDYVRIKNISNQIINALNRGIAASDYDNKAVYTQHLKDLNWEIFVVDDKQINACCLPGGKIIVSKGLLKYFSTDAEIATVIGHEVGHITARHAADRISHLSWFILLDMFLDLPYFIELLSRYLLELPYSRMQELEADQIGLFLLASAGYDPRVGPKVYEKLGEFERKGGKDYFSTHPSGKKRAQLLSQAEVMDQALAMFLEGISENRLEH